MVKQPTALAPAAKSPPVLRGNADAAPCISKVTLTNNADVVPPYYLRLRFIYTIIIGLALGIASGLWINARITSFATRSSPTISELSPSTQTMKPLPALSTAIENQHDDTALTIKAALSPVSDELALIDPQRTPATKTRGNTSRGTQAAAFDAIASVAQSKNLPPKIVRRSGEMSEIEIPATTKRAPAKSGQCLLSTSKNTLTLRDGGTESLTLRLSEPTAPTHIVASTPDWANIVLFPESQNIGSNNTMKYSIRSVSKQAGTYRVNIKTPCGSKTIPVKVMRP